MRLSLITLRSRAEELRTCEVAARKGISSDWNPTRSPRVMLPAMTWAPPTPITAVVISRTDRLGMRVDGGADHAHPLVENQGPAVAARPSAEQGLLGAVGLQRLDRRDAAGGGAEHLCLRGGEVAGDRGQPARHQLDGEHGESVSPRTISISHR